MRKAIKRAGSKNKLCALAVPSSAVITKVITMPANLSDQDMRDLAAWFASQTGNTLTVLSED